MPFTLASSDWGSSTIDIDGSVRIRLALVLRTNEEVIRSDKNESVVLYELDGVKVPAIDAFVTLDCRLRFEG